jgi:hypothetical protein
MDQTTGILDLAARAACRAFASWQALTAPPGPSGEPAPGDESAGTEQERRAA